MQFFELKEQLKNFTVFSLSDMKKIEPKFYQPRLSEWQNKGYIKMLRRGYYIFAKTELSEERFFLIANKLYAPSYVSLEMALSYYNLIPEGVYSITSVTSQKTAKFKTPIGQFFYRSIKPELMFGYAVHTIGKEPYRLAEIEKAVLDYIYLNPTSTRKADLQEWRFNSEEFLAHADMDKFYRYVKVFDSPTLERRAKQFIKFIKP